MTRLSDQIHKAMLARGEWTETECDRCGQPAIILLKASLIETGAVLSPHRLCRACHTDFAWFMVTPPEQPDTSSGSIIENEEEDDGRQAT